MITHFSCEILGKPKISRIDLDEAHEVVQTLETWRNTLKYRSWPGGAKQLVLLRDTFMRAAYASNRPHRKNSKPRAEITITAADSDIFNQEEDING